MDGRRIIRKTVCGLCGYLCGLSARIEDGKILEIEPDPSRFPYDATIVRGCARCRHNLELLDHPTRVNYPMKRVGERGSGQWERITWRQALDDIALRLHRLKAIHGSEALATSIGGPHTAYWPLHRFMNLFGSPNNMGIGQMCWNPAIWANTVTFGWPVENELDPKTTSCAILWGANPAESDNSLFWRNVMEYSRTGSPLIVVDPRRTRTALRATHWLSIRPGSDCALALGLLHVIVVENLYDRAFVEKWCEGFEALERYIEPYTPAAVEGVTGIDAVLIRKTASLYARCSPAALITGRAIDQIGANSFQTHRALALLRAITGNVDLPGASHLAERPDLVPEIDMELSDRIPESQRRKQLGGDRWAMQSYRGYDLINRYTIRASKRLPMRYLTSVHPNLVWQAMLKGDPYRIRAMIVMASNPLLAQADCRLIYEALKSLDLLVVLDLYKTPTAMLADYLLPLAGSLERPMMQTNAGTDNIAYGGEAAVEPLHERRVNFDFWRGLAGRMGQEKDWPWQTYRESLDYVLSPLGISWREFCEAGLYCPPKSYRKHEEMDPVNGRFTGFATPSGKIEIRSEILDQLANQAFPVCRTPSLPDSDAYPLTLITGARKQPYYASAFRQVTAFRRLHPEPLAEISHETADRLRLTEGEMVWVESPYGKARFKLKEAEMRDYVVSIEFGWWYPEERSQEPEMGGIWTTNANLLTNADADKCDNVIGQWVHNGFPCRVYPAFENPLSHLGENRENTAQ